MSDPSGSASNLKQREVRRAFLQVFIPAKVTEESGIPSGLSWTPLSWCGQPQAHLTPSVWTYLSKRALDHVRADMPVTVAPGESPSASPRGLQDLRLSIVRPMGTGTYRTRTAATLRLTAEGIQLFRFATGVAILRLEFEVEARDGLRLGQLLKATNAVRSWCQRADGRKGGRCLLVCRKAAARRPEGSKAAARPPKRGRRAAWERLSNGHVVALEELIGDILLMAPDAPLAPSFADARGGPILSVARIAPPSSPGGEDATAFRETAFRLHAGYDVDYLPPAVVGTGEWDGLFETFDRIAFCGALEGAAALYEDRGIDFDNQFCANARHQYSLVYLLALHQREAMLRLAERAASLPDLGKQDPDAKEIRDLRDALREFRLHHRFTDVARTSMYAGFYALLERRLNLAQLHSELDEEIAEIDAYLQQRRDERLGDKVHGLNVIVAALATLGLGVSYLGANIVADMTWNNPSVWLPCAGCVALTVVLAWKAWPRDGRRSPARKRP